MIGRTYLERGKPVVVLRRWTNATEKRSAARTAWRHLSSDTPIRFLSTKLPRFGPRNVLIERADGSRVVRPFRGLRRTEEPGHGR